MLTLININRMRPLIGPVGLDYVAAAARRAGLDARVLDLALAEDPDAALRRHFDGENPALVGLTLRNTDDCFWPSAQSFVPQLRETVGHVRRLTDAPIVLGGGGYSILPERILHAVGADFGVRGDGEAAIPALLGELLGRRRFNRVPGLLWRDGEAVRANAPAWPEPLSLPAARDCIDNAAYFRRGGQGGVETKRGCDRRCLYCADPLIKGRRLRCREPRQVAEEFQALLARGVDVLHLCDGEFNIPADHARSVCEELIARGPGRRVRWYTYMAVRPFDAELAGLMRRAGCVGINFTTDSACAAMLRAYGHAHRRDDIARAVSLCRDHGLRVMLDLLLGGPGETPETVAETVSELKAIGPDAVGAAMGVRVYPGTPIGARIESSSGDPAGIRRRYDGPLDLLRPTFYISPALGERPASVVREQIAGDERFFEPADEAPDGRGHNYNENTPLIEAIARGQRGAYWDILRRMRQGAA